MSIRERLDPDNVPSGTLLKSECLAALKLMPDNSVDSIVTDPPYELTAGKNGGTGLASLNTDSPAGGARIGTGGFRGKSWDATGIAHNVDFWRECLRVLKPGGHLLAAGGTRTYHRLACAIEDAGFEIRDSIMWVYGSGFPKSLDVSKAIDKAAGVEREVLSSGRPVKRMIPGSDQNRTSSWIKDNGREFTPTRTTPATPDAQRWDGWGTALKPAVEPFVLARKPIVGTVASNVLTYGTGALNIDESRIESTDSQLAEKYASVRNAGPRNNAIYGGDARDRSEGNVEPHALGRFPTNLLHDGSDEVVAGFPATAPSRIGEQRSGVSGDGWGMTSTGAEYNDEGSAARFFKTITFDVDNDVQSFIYCAKAGSSERDAGLEGVTTRHPTVKPVALMRYLITLVTPPDGVVLDPFLGSGTTAVAAILDGFDWIGCEMTEEYWPIIEGRVAWAEETRLRTPPSLFDAPDVEPTGKPVVPARSVTRSLFDVLADAQAS